MMIPVAASAHTHVFVGINLGGLIAPPPVEVYSAPAYYPPPVYYTRSAYYEPRVIYREPQVVYYHRWHRDWDHDRRSDWDRDRWHRDWHERDDGGWHHDGRRGDDNDEQ
ncbi:MAG: hypothetical protein EPN68_10650 [Rhodanobacter sp.]|nr:MAG: hypothetical protein EPN68_10650 [Rhodanobacter sp.]